MTETANIYIGLLDEGVDVWRPVTAEIVGSSTYKIIEAIPVGEQWEFQPGDVVHCSLKPISGEMCLVADKKLI